MSIDFDPVKKRDSLVNSIREYSKEQGFTKAVLGISGGKDSTVTAALLARALGADNVYGVMLPDGQQKDISDSMEVCKALGIHSRIVNIGDMHKALTAAVPDTVEDGFEVPYSRESDINVAPRLRMTVLRYITQALGARLAGTGNLSEATVGYCTKDGDTSCDFACLLSLTSVEVVEVGLTMEEIPQHLVKKTPTDGLSGMSDEEKLGISYQCIHDYIRKGSCGDPDIDEQIRKKEAASLFKRKLPPVMQ